MSASPCRRGRVVGYTMSWMAASRWEDKGGGETKERHSTRSTPLYGCSPGHRLELVTRFYCSVANYRRLVINGLYDTQPTRKYDKAAAFVLRAAEMTCRVCLFNRIAESPSVSSVDGNVIPRQSCLSNEYVVERLRERLTFKKKIRIRHYT